MKYSNVSEARIMAPPSPGIYAIAHYPSIYIGSTSNLKRRFIEHQHQHNKKQRKQAKLSGMYKLHGFENCEVHILYSGSEYNSKELSFAEHLIQESFRRDGYQVVSGHNRDSGVLSKSYGHKQPVEFRISKQRPVKLENDQQSIQIESVSLAASAFGISKSHVVKRCKGKLTVDGITWSYPAEKIESENALRA